MAWGNTELTDFSFVVAGTSGTITARIADFSTAANEALVVVLGTENTATMNTPEGWTLVASHNTSTPEFYVFEKVAGASEADQVFTWTGSGASAVWTLRFEGDYSSATIVDRTNYDVASGNNTSPGITPTSLNGNIFTFLFDKAGQDTPSVPTGTALLRQFYHTAADNDHAAAFKSHNSLDATGDLTWGTVTGTVAALTLNVLDSAGAGLISAQGFAPTLDPIDVHARVGRVNVIGDIKGISYSPRRAQVGIAHARVGATGAALEIVVQIDPPANWFGTVNVEGPITTGTAVSGLLGQANVEGFAATFPTKEVHPQTGLVNVIGIASNERTISATNGTAQATAGTVALIEFTGEFARKPQVGHVNTYRLGETATVEAIKTIDGPTVGETNATGAAAIIETDKTFSKVGNVNAEGFAPSITSAKVVTIEAGIINAQGFAPASDTSVDVVASVGITNIEGKTSTVLPEGVGFVSGSLGESNAVGFAPTLAFQRTPKPSVGQANIIGYAPAVAGGENVVSLIRNTHVNGFAGFVSSSGWIPISQNQQSWAPASGASSTWSTIDADNTSTWTEIQEAS